MKGVKGEERQRSPGQPFTKGKLPTKLLVEKRESRRLRRVIRTLPEQKLL